MANGYTVAVMHAQSPGKPPVETGRNRWLILVMLIGIMLMPPIDGSALNVAVPVIQQQFHVSLGLVAWVPLIYLLVLGSCILPAGRLGDLWGFRRLFLIGIFIFTVSSLLCGLSPSLPWLIAARAVQAVGASLMMALSTAIITAVFPAHERGRALGLSGMGIALGLVVGPTLGGLLSGIHWSWIFFINVPLGIIGGLWGLRMLPALPASGRRHIDWLGMALAILTLGALLLAITQGKSWGWGSAPTVGLLACGLACGAAFVAVERRQRAPMLDLTLFKNPVFTGAAIASKVNFLGQFSALFLTPLVLQHGLHLSPAKTGLVMAVIPATIFVLAPISGALSDRLGTRGLAIIGEVVVALGLLSLAIVVPGGRLLPMVLSLAPIGIGSGLFQAPNNSALMGSVPRTHLGIGGGVLATMRNLGMAFGIAVSSAVVTVAATQSTITSRTELALFFHQTRLAYLIGMAFVLLGALTSAVRQDAPRAKTSM